MVAFEDSTALSGQDASQQSTPGGPLPMDKLAEQLRAVSAQAPTSSPGGDVGMQSLLKMSQAAQGASGAPAYAGRNVPATLGGASNASGLTQKSEGWLGQQDTTGQSDPPPLTPKAKPSEFVLFEGTSIPIVLTRDVNSDLPGQISAMVTQDIYDSVDNRYLLIPAGARLTGSYNSDVVAGQSRLLMAFSRLFFPNGASVRLGAMQANDVNGAAGAEAEVNNHFFQMFGSSLIIGTVALAAAPAATSSTNLTINMSGGGSGAGAMAGQILSDSVKRILDRNQNIKPTLSLGKGERLALITTRDMVLPPTVTGGRQVY
jgi:type IV secretion system protein VirB10